MFVLTFGKTRSKYFEKALELSKTYIGEWDSNTVTIRIPDEIILDAYDLLLPILSVICKWKSTKATYNNEKVSPYVFLFSIHQVNKCAINSDDDSENYWISVKCKGWGCRKISHISYLKSGNGDYKKSNRFWYNFGHFNNKGIWIIDKKMIERKLLNNIKTVVIRYIF